MADDSDDDFGPAPLPSDAAEEEHRRQVKKRRRLEHEALYLSAIPESSRYEKSYMHRDTVRYFQVTYRPSNVRTSTS